VALVACDATPIIAPERQVAPRAASQAVNAAVAGRYLVTFSNNIPGDFANRVATLGGSVKYAHAAAGIATVVGLSDAAAASLAAGSGVAAVEPDVAIRVDDGVQSQTIAAPDALARRVPASPISPANPAAAIFYGLGYQWNMQAIHADQAWAAGKVGSPDVTVAIIDSGVEPDHPAIGGRLVRSLRVELDRDGPHVEDDPEPADLVGHGTACAGIIHAIAPAADLVSIRVLGPDSRGAGPVFAAAIEWAIAEGVGVVNLSLSSRSEAMAARFHELADEAYFANTLLVAAANNVAGPSYPSLFAAVVSVAAHDVADPDVWFYNPAPPVEFGAHGLDVDVAWRGGSRIRATGNSFAAPHLAGRAALVRAEHPDASPFEVKAILAATADDVPIERAAFWHVAGRDPVDAERLTLA
jgi:subtilisin family serine protease